MHNITPLQNDKASDHPKLPDSFLDADINLQPSQPSYRQNPVALSYSGLMFQNQKQMRMIEDMKKDLETKDKIIKMLMDKIDQEEVRASRSKLSDRPMIKDSNSPYRQLGQSNSKSKMAVVTTPGSNSNIGSKPTSGWNNGRVDTLNKKYRLEDSNTRLS